MSCCAQIFTEKWDAENFLSSKRIFHQTHDDSTLRLGTIISICFYDKDVKKDHDLVVESKFTYAHICRVDSSYEQLSFSKSSDSDREGLVMLRYDDSVKLSLASKDINQSENRAGNNYEDTWDVKVNDTMKNLSTFFNDKEVSFRPIYNILDMGTKITPHTDIPKKRGNERICWMSRFDNVNVQAEQPANVIGVVVGIFSNPSLSKNRDNEQRINLVPSTLLSVALSRQKQAENHNALKKSNGDDQNDVLLQQCLKRQLVGKLIVSPLRPTYNCSVKVNANNVKTGKLETHTLVVNEVVSLKTGISSSYSSSLSSRQTNLYKIMPSTRITLHSSTQGDSSFVNDDDERKSSDQIERPKHEKLLVQTIQAIRMCSNIVGENSNISPVVDIPRAFLLSGTPGVGKTYSVKKAVEASSLVGPTKLISIRGSELLSNGQSSDAAVELNNIFNTALSFVARSHSAVCLLFMDECDALFSSPLISASLANLLDQMSSSFGANTSISNNYDFDKQAWKRLIVIAATNRIDAIPSMLRRPGRFDRELCIPPPDRMQRFAILNNLLKEFEIRNKGDGMDSREYSSEDYHELLNEVAELCVGYVPSDLAALVRRAVSLSIEEGESRSSLCISKEHFQLAMKDVGASALRDSMISAPPTTRWDDIAGDAGGAKTALRRAIEWPKLKRREFESLGLKPPRGILLHGPPGCAKTTLVRAAAGSVGVAFLSLSPADVYASSYVGEAEAVIRRTFSLARSAAPCILFFDEIDTIVGTSSNASGMDRGTNAEARVLSTFLNEMDGVDGSINDGVLVLGATNRPSTLDSAILRPGRFDRVIYVPPPDQEGRRQILASQYQDKEINVEDLSKDEITGSMTGAEIVGACREAAMMTVRELLSGRSTTPDQIVPSILQLHIEQSLKQCKPLLSDPDVLEEYTRFEKKHSRI